MHLGSDSLEVGEFSPNDVAVLSEGVSKTLAISRLRSHNN
jgi:hypothetical protein